MIKVKETEIQQNKLIAKGKLVLIKYLCDTWVSTQGLCFDERSKTYFISDNPYLNDQFSKVIIPIKPIIISEIEDMEVSNMIYNLLNHDMGNNKFHSTIGSTQIWRKILALSEHFSPEILKMIVNGELEDGDEVLLECEGFFIPKEEWDGEMGGEYIKNIKLNNQNHIIIIPDEWKEIELEYIKEHPPFSAPYPDFTEWLKHNYHAPKRK